MLCSVRAAYTISCYRIVGAQAQISDSVLGGTNQCTYHTLLSFQVFFKIGRVSIHQLYYAYRMVRLSYSTFDRIT